MTDASADLARSNEQPNDSSNDDSANNARQNYLAAIDLGSNSFHLTIAREVQGELQLIDRIGEKVQLASGLDDNKMLDQDSMDRGLACLELFAQRIKGIPDESVRIVGTNTLRVARNRKEFIQKAEALLGSPVEVISGREEARLIYLGVAHSCADDEDQRLVIDIGGGSTELIIGKRFTPIELESMHMGCVSYTLRFFPDGKLKKRNFEQAIEAAHLELLPIRKRYKKLGWKDVMGASGTIRAAYNLINGDDPASNQPITLEGLYRLRDNLITFGRIESIAYDDVKNSRANVLAGGFAILIAVFEALKIDNMQASEGALREGLLYDHIGRLHHEDVRERTINALMERYYVDVEQAARVEKSVLEFLANSAHDSAENRSLLSWVSRIHEIGLAISHSHFHKHGSYLLLHSDLMGFNQQEQLSLAMLVLGHRRKLPVSELQSLSEPLYNTLTPLLVLFRLAVTLHHSRQDDDIPETQFSLKSDNTATLSFPTDWLAQHPLTVADIEKEQQYLKALGILLDYA